MANTVEGVLLNGTHAARPAATAVSAGTLYACSDHDLIYQSDASAWATWSDVTGGGGGGGFPTFSGAKLTKSTTQGVNATTAAITFDGEVFDTDTFHDNATNNTRLTIPTTGHYMIGGSVSYESGAGSTNITRITNNGSFTNGWGYVRTSETGFTSMHFSVVASLSATDFVELEFETSGNRTVRTSSNGTSFWIARLA